jgi:hypothetical protein
MGADVLAVWYHGVLTPLVCKRLRPADADSDKQRGRLRAEGDAPKRMSAPEFLAEPRDASLYKSLALKVSFNVRPRRRLQGRRGGRQP